MATSAGKMAGVSKLQHPILLEQVWQVAMSQFAQGVLEVILPTNLKPLLGDEGISIIAQRYSALIRAPAVIFVDAAIDAIRMVPRTRPVGALQQVRPQSSVHHAPSSGTASSASTNAAANTTKARAEKGTPVEKGKVPRPPNAFILYRQQHHPVLKHANPKMHNNEISIILGNQWKKEDESTKVRYRDMARALKEQHGKDHPQYQYQPRKPSEKKRRMTRGKDAAPNNDSGSLTYASNADQGGLVANASPEQSGTVMPTDNSNTATETGDFVSAESAEGTEAPAYTPGPVNADVEKGNTNPGSSGNLIDVVNVEPLPTWVNEGDGIFSLDVGDVDDETLRGVLTDFNENIAEPVNNGPFDFPSSPITAQPNVDAEIEDDLYRDLTDFEYFEREIAQRNWIGFMTDEELALHFNTV